MALIYLSYIKQRMFQAGLFAKYTMDELLDELDSIECFIEPGKHQYREKSWLSRNSCIEI